MQIFGLEGTNLLIAVVACLVAIFLIARSFSGRRERGGDEESGGTAAPASAPMGAGAPEGELVAVIAAAVAAASGMAPGSFRVAGVEPAQYGASGFNTPVWGHADRIGRASFKA
jgi:hypothetical protein